MTRKTYDSGAERDSLDEVRYDLISPIALRRLATTYAEGAVKYSPHNWRKGFPVSSLLNHVLAHLADYLESRGMTPLEDHLAHAAWGLFALMEQEETHPELDDRWSFGEPKPSAHSIFMEAAAQYNKHYQWAGTGPVYNVVHGHYVCQDGGDVQHRYADGRTCGWVCPTCNFHCGVEETIPVVSIPVVPTSARPSTMEKEWQHGDLHDKDVVHYHENGDMVYLGVARGWMTYQEWSCSPD